MLKVVAPVEADARIEVAPARTAVVSWNSDESRGRLEVRVERADGAISRWLPYVAWDPRERQSLNGSDEVAAIDTDVIRATSDFVAIEVRSMDPLDALFVTTPPSLETAPGAEPPPIVLEVPAISQYMPEFPEQRGWCAPAALAMLLGFWGISKEVVDVAEGVLDTAYDGTGNWAFNMAYAGSLGLRGTVAYLRDLAHAGKFIEAGIPIAVSISWSEGDLAHVPIEHSDGHIVVICGFEIPIGDSSTYVVVNDPAQSPPRTHYNLDGFARAWLGHGGVAFLVAPRERGDDLVRLANE